MNKDLKKIIKEIECYQNEDMCMIMLSQKENKALLDYITNLQQENERLKGSISAMKHNYNLLTTLIENGESMTQKFENGLTQKDYKSRIEKAIEYIEKERFIKDGNLGIYVDLDYNDTEHLLNILKGENKENG